jgi:hypothetical protein
MASNKNNKSIDNIQINIWYQIPIPFSPYNTIEVSQEYFQKQAEELYQKYQKELVKPMPKTPLPKPKLPL